MLVLPQAPLKQVEVTFPQCSSKMVTAAGQCRPWSMPTTCPNMGHPPQHGASTKQVCFGFAYVASNIPFGTARCAIFPSLLSCLYVKQHSACRRVHSASKTLEPPGNAGGNSPTCSFGRFEAACPAPCSAAAAHQICSLPAVLDSAAAAGPVQLLTH